MQKSMVGIDSALCLGGENCEYQSGDFRYSRLEGGGIVIGEYTGKEKELTVPDTIDGLPVKMIGCCAFSENKTLEQITLPETVTQIGDFTFAHSIYLKEIELPSSLTYIGANAFERCLKLEYIDVPKGVKTIEHGAFAQCRNMIAASLPGTLSVIPSSAFDSCSGLQRVDIPCGVTQIEGMAFWATALRIREAPIQCTAHRTVCICKLLPTQILHCFSDSLHRAKCF